MEKDVVVLVLSKYDPYLFNKKQVEEVGLTISQGRSLRSKDISSDFNYVVVQNGAHDEKGNYSKFCFDASFTKPYFSTTDNWIEF